MKTGLVITTYNRPEYLAQCLESVKHAIIPKGTLIIIVDDASTNQKTIDLVSAFTINGISIIKIFKKENKTVCDSLIIGIERAFEEGCEVVMNLDGDAIVKRDFISRLLDLRRKWNLNDNIATGFNSENKNKDGSERHPVISKATDMIVKKSVGGINMCFNQDVYTRHIKPALVKGAAKQGNWDHMASISSGAIACTAPSVIQHIGFDSSMGHNEPPDVASDFHEIELPEVTLIGVDCVDLKRLVKAIDISCQRIKFGDVKIITGYDQKGIINPDRRLRGIEKINTIEDYSKFMINNLHEYIDTTHALVIQHDGYVLNPSAWNDEFLEYDYIGARWHQYPTNNVGNGGFSLRSKELMRALAGSPVIQEYHPEDHIIGRTYRNYLEMHCNIRFAPSHIADEFSIEAYKNPNPIYRGQFGFHGGQIDFSRHPLSHVPYQKNPVKTGYINKRDLIKQQ